MFYTYGKFSQNTNKCVGVCECVCVYPDRSLGHSFLVECASSLPAVDGVLHLSAELACC